MMEEILKQAQALEALCREQRELEKMFGFIPLIPKIDKDKTIRELELSEKLGIPVKIAKK